MDRRKELKQQYKQMKPDMGIYAVYSKINNKYFVEATQNLKGKINGTKFKLGAGGHPNRELQREWTENGEENFAIEILEKLEYDKDESKTDYSEELALLEMMWRERLAEKGIEFYKR
jgi:hypothetical protein